jgi:hypothetical protein
MDLFLYTLEEIVRVIGTDEASLRVWRFSMNALSACGTPAERRSCAISFQVIEARMMS